MRTLPAVVAIAAAALTLTACGDPQVACDNLSLTQEAQDAAHAAAAEGFEVEKEVEYDGGTAECVWDPSERRLVGTDEDE